MYVQSLTNKRVDLAEISELNKKITSCPAYCSSVPGRIFCRALLAFVPVEVCIECQRPDTKTEEGA